MILKTTTTTKLMYRFPLFWYPRTWLLLNLFVLVFLPCTIYPTTAALCNVSNAVADSGGGGGRPPTGQNFLNFMQFFVKSGKIICWCPPRGLAPPSTGNPGSAPNLIIQECIPVGCVPSAAVAGVCWREGCLPRRGGAGVCRGGVCQTPLWTEHRQM